MAKIDFKKIDTYRKTFDGILQVTKHVGSEESLPTSGAQNGDIYSVGDSNTLYIFNDLEWRTLGSAGVTSATVTVDESTGTPSASASVENGVLSISFSGLKGKQGIQGNTGSSVDYPYELVNNLTTDDATKGLSAAQGVVLDGKVSQLRTELDGITNDTYTINGYDILVGSYHFKGGVAYHFTISSQSSGTLYLAIVDAEGNVIHQGSGFSSFPKSFDWTPAQNYSGAQLKLGHGGVGVYDVTVKGEAVGTRLDFLESTVGTTIIDSDSIQDGNGVNKSINVAPGYVYKLVVSSTVDFEIYFQSSVSNQFVINHTAGKGVHYIPVFDDGATSPYILLYKGAGTTLDLAYTCYQMSMADFIANVKYPTNYVKALTDTLTFRWVQGYWTSPTAHNLSSAWCNTEIQFNRGRKFSITFPTGYMVVRRRINFNTTSVIDSGKITSGQTFDTSNWGPWMIGVRRSDYSALTPEQAAAAITITQISGEVYSMPTGIDETRKMISEAINAIPVPSMPSNPQLGTLELGRFMHHQNVEATTPPVPSQSLYDIAYAKALGFRMIEANCQVCSDGVTVIKHGVSGKLGNGLAFAAGSGITADTLFSAVTSTALRQNVTYDNAKYDGHIPTLDEFCAECARLGMVPFLRGCTTAMLAIARKYLPDERIIVEGPATRGDFKGMMTSYGDAGTAAGILAVCEAKGKPFYYCWSAAGTATSELFTEVAQTLHANGYLLAAAYIGRNKHQELSAMGLDINVSTGPIIPDFVDGATLNVVAMDDQHLTLTGATYDSTNDQITMVSGDKVEIAHSEIGDGLAKMCVKIIYSGDLTIRFGTADGNKDLVDYAFDGSREIVIASALLPTSGALSITANAATTIKSLKVAVSKI